MKKILTVLFTVMTAVAASAQGSPGMDMEIKQFQDKKVDSGREYYGDIPARITKVVVSGDNSMTDLLFRNSVEESWNISPYEFCDPEEWDYPIYYKQFEAQGVRSLMIEVDQESTSFEQLHTRLQSLVETL